MTDLERVMLKALVDCEQRINELCSTVNILHKQTGGNGRKVHAECWADVASTAIAKAKASA